MLEQHGAIGVQDKTINEVTRSMRVPINVTEPANYHKGLKGWQRTSCFSAMGRICNKGWWIDRMESFTSMSKEMLSDGSR